MLKSSKFQKECMSNLKNYPVLRSFLIYKSHFRLAKQLLCVWDFKIRKYIAQFRLSSHQLATEVGRHVKPKAPVNQDLSKRCNLNVIMNVIIYQSALGSMIKGSELFGPLAILMNNVWTVMSMWFLIIQWLIKMMSLF